MVQKIPIEGPLERWSGSLNKIINEGVLEPETLGDLSSFLAELSAAMTMHAASRSDLDFARSVCGFYRACGDVYKSTQQSYEVVLLLLNEGRSPRSIVDEQYSFLSFAVTKERAEEYILEVKKICLDFGIDREKVDSLDEVARR